MKKGSAFSAHNKRWVEKEIHSPPGAGCFSVLSEIQKQSLKRKGQKGKVARSIWRVCSGKAILAVPVPLLMQMKKKKKREGKRCLFLD